jgi:hypothetical protein
MFLKASCRERETFRNIHRFDQNFSSGHFSHSPDRSGNPCGLGFGTQDCSVPKGAGNSCWPLTPFDRLQLSNFSSVSELVGGRIRNKKRDCFDNNPF